VSMQAVGAGNTDDRQSEQPFSVIAHRLVGYVIGSERQDAITPPHHAGLMLRLLHDVRPKYKPRLQHQQNDVESSRIPEDRKGRGHVRRYHRIECTLGMTEMQ